MPTRRSFALAFSAALLAACSQDGNAPTPAQLAAQQQAAREAQAAQKQALYQAMVNTQRYALAVPIGQEIVTRYAGTQAAAAVQKTLPEVQRTAAENAEKARLQALWSYQTGKESGGTQITASIYSSRPGGDDRVRLVLRRHSAWGQSVYLFGSGRGFACSGRCSIPIGIDGAPPKPWKAYLPETGEPAIFIEDDGRFIAALAKAKKLTMQVELKGRGSETLVFEVGGYDPARFPPLPGKR
ncbi:hypothetical protein MBSD_n2055 [Mizugakiibacter sediminis]|uniref:Lipoprotein n=1 Tax=Mizugakiibacter sediminis TaxID=1475481 RepID=A0A0K8QPC6_9GAMM|nr:hypothetical protein [Mizugakiibacter sediminis]GAP66740.1 hypothetical protein MBSD_n2055 [Mizugakiibacter sediminis]